MRYRLTAIVDGDIELATTTTVSLGEMTYLYESVDGQLASVSVETRVSAADFRSEIRPKTADEPVTIEFFSDADTHDRLLRELQEVEAHLAFSTHGALASLRWEQVSAERVPDSPEEEELVPARAVTVTNDYPRPKASLTPDNLTQLSALKGEHRELVSLKTFWREAVNEYHNLRFVQAFYNYFLILEGLFAPGKSRQREVIKAFQSSTELRGYAERMLEAARSSERHWSALEAHWHDYGCVHDASGLLELVVQIRGTLHHFAPRSPRSRVHAFAQDEFQTIAWIAFGLSTHALMMRDRAMPHPPIAQRLD